MISLRVSQLHQYCWSFLNHGKSFKSAEHSWKALVELRIHAIHDSFFISLSRLRKMIGELKTSCPDDILKITGQNRVFFLFPNGFLSAISPYAVRFVNLNVYRKYTFWSSGKLLRRVKWTRKERNTTNSFSSGSSIKNGKFANLYAFYILFCLFFLFFQSKRTFYQFFAKNKELRVIDV